MSVTDAAAIPTTPVSPLPSTPRVEEQEEPGIIKRTINKVIAVVVAIFSFIGRIVFFWRSSKSKSPYATSLVERRTISQLAARKPLANIPTPIQRTSSTLTIIEPAKSTNELPTPYCLKKQFSPPYDKLQNFARQLTHMIADVEYEKNLVGYLDQFLVNADEYMKTAKKAAKLFVTPSNTPIFHSLYVPGDDDVISHDISTINTKAQEQWNWLLYESKQLPVPSDKPSSNRGPTALPSAVDLQKILVKELQSVPSINDQTVETVETCVSKIVEFITTTEKEYNYIENFHENISEWAFSILIAELQNSYQSLEQTEKSVQPGVRANLASRLKKVIEYKIRLKKFSKGVNPTLDSIFDLEKEVSIKNKKIVEEALFHLQECQINDSSVQEIINRSQKALTVEKIKSRKLDISKNSNKKKKDFDDVLEQVSEWVFHTDHSKAFNYTNGNNDIATHIMQEIITTLIQQKVDHFFRLLFVSFQGPRGHDLFHKTVMTNVDRFSQILSARLVSVIQKISIRHTIDDALTIVDKQTQCIYQGTQESKKSKQVLEKARVWENIEGEAETIEEQQTQENLKKILQNVENAGGNETYLHNAFREQFMRTFLGPEEAKNWTDSDKPLVPSILNNTTYAKIAKAFENILLSEQWLLPSDGQSEATLVVEGDDLLFGQISFPEELDGMVKRGHLLAAYMNKKFPELLKYLVNFIWSSQLSDAKVEIREGIKKVLSLMVEPNEIKDLIATTVLPSLIPQLFIVHAKEIFLSRLDEDCLIWINQMIGQDLDDENRKKFVKRIYTSVKEHTSDELIDALKMTEEKFIGEILPWVSQQLSDLEEALPNGERTTKQIKAELTKPSNMKGKGKPAYGSLIENLLLNIGEFDKEYQSSQLISSWIPWAIHRYMHQISDAVGHSLDQLSHDLIDLMVDNASEKWLLDPVSGKQKIEKLIFGEPEGSTPKAMQEQTERLALVVHNMAQYQFNVGTKGFWGGTAYYVGKTWTWFKGDKLAPPTQEELSGFFTHLYSKMLDDKELNSHLIFQLQKKILTEFEEASDEVKQEDEEYCQNLNLSIKIEESKVKPQNEDDHVTPKDGDNHADKTDQAVEADS